MYKQHGAGIAPQSEGQEKPAFGVLSIKQNREVNRKQKLG
jgi:hypothetical protein